MSTGLIAEHQPTEPGTANKSGERLNLPEQEPDEKKDVKMVMHLFHKSKAHRANYDKDWANNYRFFRGDQWHNERPSYRHSEVINFIFQHIQSSVPIMTDTRPRPSFLPRDPSDLEFSEILDDLFDADWQHGNWMFKMAEVIYDSYFYGHGLSHLYFDPDEDYGLGRIQYRSFEPFDGYPDPDANDINEGQEFSSFWVTAEPKDVEKVRLKYRGHKYEAAIQGDMDEPKNLFSKTSMSKRAFVRPTDKDLPVVRHMSGEADEKHTGKVLVITAYLKPNDVVTEEQTITDEDGNESVQFITKKKYPNGRRIVIINGFIFEDEPNLPNADGKFPFQKHVNYILPREFYGISEVEQLASPQRIFNKLISFTLDVLTLMGNPIWLIPTSSGVDPNALHNAPGMRVPYDGDAPPQRAEGVQLQPYVVQMIDRMEQWFNSISGSQEITRGINPPSVTAASAIENLQQAAQTRLRQKMRQLDGYLVQVGEQYVQLVLQHYTQSRIFRITNEEGVEKFFKFHVEPAEDPDNGGPLIDDKGDAVKQGVFTEFIEDQELGKMVPGDPRKFLIRGQFDVKVNTETGLPFSKSEQENRLLQLFDRGIIDRRAVLEKIEFPNFEPILQRVQEQEQAAAQAQQAGGQ